MNEELQYGYPADMDDLDLDVIQYHYNNNQRFIKRIILLTAIVMILILVYCITLSSIAGAALIICVVCDIIFFSLFKKIKSHALVIEAYESYIDLQFYTSEHSYSTRAHLLYSDIMALNLSDKYDNVTISYVNRSGKSYVRLIGADGTEQARKPKHDNFFSAELNPYTPEQGFFLYYAHKLFDVKINQKTRKKILKKFGDEEMYFGLENNSGEEIQE